MVLGQYNHVTGSIESSSYFANNDISIVNVETPLDFNVVSNESSDIALNNIIFQNQAIRLTNQNFEEGKTYYVRCKINRISNAQKYNLYLLSTIPDGEGKYKQGMSSPTKSLDDAMIEQYIKTLTIRGTTSTNEWVNVEFIFTPLVNDFNSILFYLQRTNTDFNSTNQEEQKKIVVLEISELVNCIPKIIGDEESKENNVLVKMGIQTRPGFKMCINGEEISTGRTGIYELKNGEIYINFLSFIAPSNIDFTQLTYGQSTVLIPKNATDNETIIDSFTIDYIYESENTITGNLNNS